MANHIVDDVFTTLLVDIQKIQAKPTMYISYTGPRAYLHLTHEIIDNSRDEYENPKSIEAGNDGVITLMYDESDQIFYTEDHGRGIPFEELENTCTILQSGSKMTRSNGASIGENGVGMTATNALSELFEITSYRNGKMKLLQFKEGIKTLDKTSKCKSDKRGLLVAFKPSKLYLGPTCQQLDVQELDDWLTKQSFLMNPEVKIKFTANLIGKDASFNKTYQNTKGLGGFLSKFEPNANLMKAPLVLTGKTSILEENVPNRLDDGNITFDSKERFIDLDIAFNYNPESDETIRYSFVNNNETIEHGEHISGVMQAMVLFFRKKVKDESKSKKKDEIEVTNNDILFGLNVVVNMKTNFSTGLFTGQTKHKMDNRIFYDPVRKLTTELLEEFFKLPENKKILTRIIGMIRDNIKVRLAATKAKKQIKTKRADYMQSMLITGYNPPNLIGDPNVECEIYIVEGDSAAGSARTGRVDRDVQGVMGLVGKPTNAYKQSLAFINKAGNADDIKQFFNDILGCGYGPNFNIDNLNYKRILLAPDADIDGSHIAGLLAANIYKYARPLIEMGYVYRVVTPLYKLREALNSKRKGINKNLYLYSKDEFFDAYEKNASDVIKLKFNQNDNYISRPNMKRFLQTDRDYYQWLDTLAKQYYLHPDIVEFIAIHPDDFREIISECGPELKYSKENDSIYNIYDGKFYNIIIDQVFLDKVMYLTKIIREGNDGISSYHTYKTTKSGEVNYLGYLTIGNIMALCQEQEPNIQSRFKGLGEMSASEMKVLAMDPRNRVLLRLTVQDFEHTTGVLDDLFLDDKDHRAVRNEMIDNMVVTLDDIDN